MVEMNEWMDGREEEEEKERDKKKKKKKDARENTQPQTSFKRNNVLEESVLECE